MYIKISLILFAVGILFGIVGVIFNFQELFKEKAIDEKYCYFINNSGKSEKAIIADSKENGRYIIKWYENKAEGIEKYVGTSQFYILPDTINVEVLDYVYPDSSLVKIRAVFEHGKSLDNRIVGYASSLTLHDEPFSKAENN